ncbi:hypothetical protein [Sutterella sp.]|uniref:hypothetical protein n=1 Tax=Sutterella sp. TaxID=1981025 RepID=UPI0026E10FAB|nr:hypothetical protein [Sutterella sp.]MDO5531053.1 hypothetical protein [Sutterella sp.]
MRLCLRLERLAEDRRQRAAKRTPGRIADNFGTEMVPVGLKSVPLGQYHHRAKYTDEEVEEVFMLADAGFRLADICLKVEMPKSTVWAILHGRMRCTTPVTWKRRKKRF